jgi:hypothetical protein
VGFEDDVVMTESRRAAKDPDIREMLKPPGSRGYYRVVPGRPVAVPLDCWLEGAELHWKTPEPNQRAGARPTSEDGQRRSLGLPNFKTPRLGMVEGFLRLARSADEQILERSASRAMVAA